MLSEASSRAAAACVVAELFWVTADFDRACEGRRGVRWRLRAGLFASPVSAFAALFGGSLLAIAFVLWIRIALRDACTTTSPAFGARRVATQEGRRRGQQCFLCRGSRAQYVPRQRFLAARQAPSGPQRSWSSTGLFERPKNLHFGVLDAWCWRPESNREPSLTKRLQYRLCCASGW